MSSFDNRVTKYEQHFYSSESDNLKLSAAEVAVATTPLLQGTQTPDELRGHIPHVYEFNDMTGVRSTLENLATREDRPYVIHPAHEPSKRKSRYMYLFCGEVDEAIAVTDELPTVSSGLHACMEALETGVVELEQRFDSSLAHLGDQRK